MFDLPSIRLGSVFGIPIEINLSWLLIFGLITFSLAVGVYPQGIPGLSLAAYIVLAAGTAVLFFTSIVIHELSHSLVARRSGGHVDKITLFLLGGVAQIDEEPSSPGREFTMAIAGPAASLVLALIFFVFGYASYLVQSPQWITFPLEYLAIINLAVALFNLLPGFPLDGGRVLRSILWGASGDLLSATKWAARLGQFIGYAMVAWAVWRVFQGDFGWLWLGLVGWFVASLAGRAYREQLLRSQLHDVPIGRVMSPNPQVVDGEMSVEQLAHDYFLAGRHSRYPVLDQGHVVGLVTLAGVKEVSRAEWPLVRVLDVADRDLSQLVVDANASLDTTLERLAGDRPGALLVVDGGRLAGIVTRADVIAASRRLDI